MKKIVNFLSRFSIENKLKFLGYSSMFLYTIILCLDLYLDRVTLYNSRHENLVSLSAQAMTILEHYHQRVQNGAISLEDAQRKAKRLLDSIYHYPSGIYHYPPNGYFVLELDHIDEHKFALIGRTNYALDEKDIPKIADFLIESQRRDHPVEGLINRDGQPEHKIFYARLFEPWGWIIGTGDWVSDLEEEFKKLALKKLMFLIPVLCLVVFLLFVTTQSIILPLDEITKTLRRLAGIKKIKNFETSNTELKNIKILIDLIDQFKTELDLRFRQIFFLNKKLTKQNAELLDFAFVMSHDVQTPLRKIKLLVSKFQYNSRSLNPEQTKTLNQIKELVVFAKTLIEDILTFSQLSSRSLKTKWVSLAECVQEAIQLNDIYLEHLNHKITISHLPTLPIDRILMSQVFSNLLSNAIKYRHPERDLEIKIEAVLEKETWVISVSDNGLGLANTSAKHIFRPFRRGNHDTPGKGLGLAICKKIIEKHNGSIWAEPNRDGEGLSVRFTLKAN